MKLKSQMSAEEITNLPSSEEIQKVTEVKGTPFQVVTTQEGSFGVMGKYRITKTKEKETEIRKELLSDSWELRIAVMGAMNLIHDEIKKQLNNG